MRSEGHSPVAQTLIVIRDNQQTANPFICHPGA
jgi:hypothetical protein